MHLKAIVELPDPPSVEDHDVPIVDPSFLPSDHRSMDLAAEQVRLYSFEIVLLILITKEENQLPILH